MDLVSKRKNKNSLLVHSTVSSVRALEELIISSRVNCMRSIQIALCKEFFKNWPWVLPDLVLHFRGLEEN